MKRIISLSLVLFVAQLAFAQHSTSSFLANNQEGYFSNLTALNPLNKKWKLDYTRYVQESQENYLSDFQVFSPIDSRFTAYPSQDLTKHSELMLGNYSIQNMSIGNLQMNTIYIFDVTGRMVDYQTNFSLWKRKK